MEAQVEKPDSVAALLSGIWVSLDHLERVASAESRSELPHLSDRFSVLRADLKALAGDLERLGRSGRRCEAGIATVRDREWFALQMALQVYRAALGEFPPRG